MCDSPIDERCNSSIASVANKSVSPEMESTFLGILALPMTSARNISPVGPRGVLILSKVGVEPILIGLAKSNSISTDFDDKAIS